MSAIAIEPARLFTSFFDPVEMVLCCSADATAADVNVRGKAAGLRFPLVSAPSASFNAHVAAIEYASGSARFGPYVDNILGMNWELPSGRIVRVGERVIKSTTGYDLHRFLLHTDGRYGRALEYVLRLRPLGGTVAKAVLQGDEAALGRVCDDVLHSPWLHWLDVVDLVFTADEPPMLEIGADCVLGEEIYFAEFFRQLGHDHGCSLLPPSGAQLQSLPALSLKSTLSEARTLGAELVREFGGTARVLVVNGVVHYLPDVSSTKIPGSVLMALTERCAATGGHAYGPLAPPPRPSSMEARWAEELLSAWLRI